MANISLAGTVGIDLRQSWTAATAVINAGIMKTGIEGATPVTLLLGGERARDRKGQIIAAAYELLDEGGLEGLTIRAVLKRTGLARRAFYECFAGKDDLVVAVFERTLFGLAEFYEGRAREIGDPIETIRAIIQGIVLGRYEFEDDPGEFTDRLSAALSREHLRLAEARPEELHAALSPLLGLIAAQVSEGIRTGQCRACDPDLQAKLIYNLVATTVHTELLAEEAGGPDVDRRRTLAGQIWDFCHRAIRA